MKYLFFASIMLLSYSLAARPTLTTINALTVYPGASGMFSIKSIDHIIYHINKKNEVPPKCHIAINDQIHTIQPGIALNGNDQVVAIFSRGYAKTNEYGSNGNFLMQGACALSAYIQCKDNIVTGIPIISFDYDDSKKGFSFGQENSIEILELVYESVLAKNPDIQIILIGDCRGAKVVLELLTKRPRNIAAVILMAPFISARDLTNKIAQNYLNYLPLSRAILHQFFKFYFPSYNAKKDDLIKRLRYIDPDTPILVAHREHDTLVGTITIETLLKELTAQGNKHVRSVIVKDTEFEHSMLTGNKEVKFAVNRFLRDYYLPHHPGLV